MQLSQTTPTVSAVSYEEFKARQQAKAASNSNEMDKNAFLNLLIVQMQNQDPLSPMENAEFTQQTSQFAQLEQLTTMNKSMETLIELQAAIYQANQGLTSAAGFVGKYIEYDTNTVKIASGVASPISFYAQEAATTGTIRIYNANDELVGNLNISNVTQGNNAIKWDGAGLGGIELQDGTYYFEVTAYNANGDQVPIATYSEGQVTGVKIAGGMMYFECNGGLVPADSVYGVKNEASLK